MPITFACEYRFSAATFPSYNKCNDFSCLHRIFHPRTRLPAQIYGKEVFNKNYFDIFFQRKALRFKTGRESRITQPSAATEIRAAPAKRDVISEILSARVYSRLEKEDSARIRSDFNISLLTLDTDVPF